MPRARSLPGCMLMCSDRFGVRWVPVQIDAMCCDAPYGTPCFPFYRSRESKGYNGGEKRRNEKEKKSFRIVGSFFSFTRVPPTL